MTGAAHAAHRVSAECSARFDAEVMQFLALCAPTDRERAALETVHKDAGRCCLGVPGVAGALRLHGAWASRAVLPGTELDLVLPVDRGVEHVPVTLSLVAARLVLDGRFAAVTTDAAARVPWLWGIHLATDTQFAIRLVQSGSVPPMTDPHVDRLVGQRPPGVRAAVLFLKAARVARQLRDDPPSGFALTLVAGCVLSRVGEDAVERHPGLAALTLWNWIADLPDTGTVVLNRAECVYFEGPGPIRVVVPDPTDPLTDCGQANPHFWSRMKRLCRAALLLLTHRVATVGPPKTALLPGTFLHPAQWLLWQLGSR